MKALVIGATGATGTDLVNTLLNDTDYTNVVIFVRRPGGRSHPRLTEVLTNFDKLEEVADAIHGDVLFSCLGTTLKAAGSKQAQFHVDYEIPAQFAEIARKNGVGKAVLLSAYGASADSRVFYSQTKGKLEEIMTALSFHQYIIFRPGLLLRKDTDRIGERIFAGLLGLANRLGVATKFKPLKTSILAGKMAIAPKVFGNGKHIIELDKIFSL
jgi:uncharacterized protein YbjT (DUF2867 family)